MIGLNALRYSVASISSAICSSRPFSTASVTGSSAASGTASDMGGFLRVASFAAASTGHRRRPCRAGSRGSARSRAPGPTTLSTRRRAASKRDVLAFVAVRSARAQVSSSSPRLKALRKNRPPNDGAMTAATPRCTSTAAACSRDEPMPKLAPGDEHVATLAPGRRSRGARASQAMRRDDRRCRASCTRPAPAGRCRCRRRRARRGARVMPAPRADRRSQPRSADAATVAGEAR